MHLLLLFMFLFNLSFVLTYPFADFVIQPSALAPVYS